MSNLFETVKGILQEDKRFLYNLRSIYFQRSR